MTKPITAGVRISSFASPVYGCHRSNGECADILGLHRDSDNRAWYVTSDNLLVLASEWNLHQLPTFAEAE